MNRTIWLIRVLAGNGWSDYPADYGTMTNREAALSLAAKLSKEGWYSVGVYECNMIVEHHRGKEHVYEKTTS